MWSFEYGFVIFLRRISLCVKMTSHETEHRDKRCSGLRLRPMHMYNCPHTRTFKSQQFKVFHLNASGFSFAFRETCSLVKKKARIDSLVLNYPTLYEVPWISLPQLRQLGHNNFWKWCVWQDFTAKTYFYCLCTHTFLKDSTMSLPKIDCSCVHTCEIFSETAFWNWNPLEFYFIFLSASTKKLWSSTKSFHKELYILHMQWFYPFLD